MEEFVKPADLFKKRRIGVANSNNPASIIDNKSCPPISSFTIDGKRASASVAQSPMKCLNNLTNPSPSRKVSTVLRCPINQLVKRRLQLGNSPMKRHCGTTSTSSSPHKSPVKKSSRIFEMNDEDANLEPPNTKRKNSPVKKQLASNAMTCFQNNWTLRTKVKINFQSRCKNWSESSTTTHKRHSGNLMDEDTPSKVNDKTISLEAIKNAATFYQHPYLPWLPLYPRILYDQALSVNNDSERKHAQLAVSKHPAAIKAMLKAWCESLDDLTNLLIDGKCPYFYVCSDFHTILFRGSTNNQDITAFITPFTINFGLSLSKVGIDYKIDSIDDLDIENTDTSSCNSQSLNNNNTSSQSNFNASRIHLLNRTIISNFDSDGDITDEELDVRDEGDNETSQAFLDSIGVHDLSDNVRPSVRAHNLKTKLSSRDKSICMIEGIENVRQFVQYLQTNRTHTITSNGDFASIPPTLISPREFRLSTPQYPEVNVVMGVDWGPKITQSGGPRHVELRGALLPNVYRKLHKLLIVSDNADHNCLDEQLSSSLPFERLPS